MEALHASVPPHFVGDAAVRILLLDCDRQRRDRRAEALVSRGALVDQAAESLTAKTLWKPGTYDLVLVELRGADAGCTAFISSVQGECSRQKFGFYLARPPYLTNSAAQCRRSLLEHKPQPVVVEDQAEDRRHHRTPLFVATKRIAAARQLGRGQTQIQPDPRMQGLREDNPHRTPASDAVTLARRVLDGASKPEPR